MFVLPAIVSIGIDLCLCLWYLYLQIQHEEWRRDQILGWWWNVDVSLAGKNIDLHYIRISPPFELMYE